MTLGEIEVIGSDSCPYVQRVVTLLVETQTPFNYKNVDLQNKPEWFLEKSPLGKVPVLRFPDGKFIFESAIINEYIDSSLPAGKHFAPADPLVNAQNKAWLEYLGSIFGDAYGALVKPTKEEFEAALVPISKKVAALENQIVGPYWNGDKLSLIDIAAAPLFQRVAVFDKVLGRDLGEKGKHPKVAAWLKTLLELPALNIAAALQKAEDPALSNPHDNIKAIAAHKVDPVAARAGLEKSFRDSAKRRFAGSYAVSLL